MGIGDRRLPLRSSLREVPASLIERGLEERRVQAGENLTLVHVIVVVGVYRLNRAGNLCSDADRILWVYSPRSGDVRDKRLAD